MKVHFASDGHFYHDDPVHVPSPPRMCCILRFLVLPFLGAILVRQRGSSGAAIAQGCYITHPGWHSREAMPALHDRIWQASCSQWNCHFRFFRLHWSLFICDLHQKWLLWLVKNSQIATNFERKGKEWVKDYKSRLLIALHQLLCFWIEIRNLLLIWTLSYGKEVVGLKIGTTISFSVTHSDRSLCACLP